ncbi:hypothetical protein AAE478_004198 [Parahypoxylon ruwenzoriense]
MSQTTTPRKSQNRGHQNHQSQPSSYPHSPHSHPHSHSQHQQQHQQQYQQHQHYHQLQQGHARNRSQQLRAQAAELQFSGTSDYESDTANYMASHPAPPPAALAARTNTELNLKVLRRYRPNITTILSIAANAVVYTFSPPAKWEKSNMEGTLFICAQKRGGDEDGEDEGGEALSDGCLFILNRKSLQNLILDLKTVCEIEPTNGLLIFDLDDNIQVPMENGESVSPKVLGIWMYAEDEQDRRTNTAVIYEMWTKARARASPEGTDSADRSTTSASVTEDTDNNGSTIMQEAGRQVSLNELFGRSQNGTGGA